MCWKSRAEVGGAAVVVASTGPDQVGQDAELKGGTGPSLQGAGEERRLPTAGNYRVLEFPVVIPDSTLLANCGSWDDHNKLQSFGGFHTHCEQGWGKAQAGQKGCEQCLTLSKSKECPQN